MASDLYYQVLSALSRTISDKKKIELYDYFDSELRNIIPKTEYNETHNPNNDTVSLTISPTSLTEDHFATILGILIFE